MTQITEQELLKEIDDHMKKMWCDGLLPHNCWPVGLAKRVSEAARRDPVVAVPQSIEQMAVDRYKVVPSHSSMFYPCAVVAGDGQQQLYIGRAVECQNMARKFTGAFLDGAFVALAAAPQLPEAMNLKREDPVSNATFDGLVNALVLAAMDAAHQPNDKTAVDKLNAARRQLLAAQERAHNIG